LFSLAGQNDATWLKRVPLFVSHPRISRTAFHCGVRTVCVARARADLGVDQALADALCNWFYR